MHFCRHTEVCNFLFFFYSRPAMRASLSPRGCCAKPYGDIHHSWEAVKEFQLHWLRFFFFNSLFISRDFTNAPTFLCFYLIHTCLVYVWNRAFCLTQYRRLYKGRHKLVWWWLVRPKLFHWLHKPSSSVVRHVALWFSESQNNWRSKARRWFTCPCWTCDFLKWHLL